MPDKDFNEGFTEDSQEYIEGRLETGAMPSLDAMNQRLEELERDISLLQQQETQGSLSDDDRQRLDVLRRQRDEQLRSRER